MGFYFQRSGKPRIRFVREGDLVKRPNLADTLELIGNNGSSAAFYDPEGPIVSSLVEEIQRTGGWITAEDFSNYEVNVEKALKFDFKTPEVDTEDTNDYTLYTASGASSGLALIAGLNFFLSLENFNATDDKLLRVHRVIETMKWMASARSNFGDFSIHQDNSTFRENLIDKYSSKKWAQETIDRKYSDNNTFPWEHYDPKYQLTEPHGTSHFSIVDANGNAVGMTTTVNLLFGSLVYDNKTGVILNNEMDDFSVPGLPNAFNLTPLIYNFIEPRKRPLSSTSPTIVVTNQGVSLLPSLVIGAAGGSRITTAILQSIINVFYDKVPLLEAISYPRLHHQLIPEYVMCENYEVFEDRYQVDDLLEILNEDFGHDFYQSGPLTVMNGIRRKDSGDTTGAGEHDTYSWQGVADYWRKLGEASGY